MYRFWDLITRPLLDVVEPSVVVEIGSETGAHTKKLAEVCSDLGAVLHVVDPDPQYDTNELEHRFDGTVVHHFSLSLNALHEISDPDMVLVDGDHNYYTVHNELLLLERKTTDFPIVLLHDVDWPYGRRDLYYDPERIPEAYRKPWRRAGIRPDSTELDPYCAFNAHLCNAIYENELRNGVRTAVEDFLAEREHLRMWHIPGLHGLAVVHSCRRSDETGALAQVLSAVVPDEGSRALAELLERERLRAIVSEADLKQRANELRNQFQKAEKSLETAQQDVAKTSHELRQERELREDAERQLGEVEQSLRWEQTERARMEERVDRGGDPVELAEQLDAERAKRQDIEDRWKRDSARYQRLRSRKAVRAALACAQIAGPLISCLRSVRARQRKGRRDTGDRGGHAEGNEAGAAQSASTGVTSGAGAPPLNGVQRESLVTVIVPVFNAPEEVERCVTALRAHTSGAARLVLVDDASTDASVHHILERAESVQGISVLRNETNLGFTRSVNKALGITDGDVVILNSDTRVGPRWLQNLRQAAYSRDDVAAVSPLSDKAGVFSAPVEGGVDLGSLGLAWDEAALQVSRGSRRERPVIPTAHGFCLYVRRNALNRVGLFDAKAFPRGYGEETDFCLRSRQLGFVCVLDDATYVQHTQAASFGDERKKLVDAGRKIIDKRYPYYTNQVQELKREPWLMKSRQQVADSLERRRPEWHKPRILSVLHDGAGGTPQTNQDLMISLMREYSPWIMTSSLDQITVSSITGQDGGQWWFEKPWEVMDISRRDFAEAYREVMESLDIDVLHIRHLMGHTFDLPAVAKALGVPTVLSIHDYYLACPTIHLIDENRKFCGGRCTATAGDCELPTQRLGETPPLKHEWVHYWRSQVRAALKNVDALITTSEAARDVFLNSMGDDPDLPTFYIIEHGRSFPRRGAAAQDPDPEGPIRIAVPGNIGVHKGLEVFRRLKELDTDGRLELHFIGDITPGYEALGIQHGPYDRESIVDKLEEIRPSFCAIFSIWAETHSHTLTEAWAAGVPVLASKLGALEERVEQHGGGWLLDLDEPETVYRRVLEIAQDISDYKRVQEEVTNIDLRSVSSMAEDYAMVYRNLMEAKRSFPIQ